VFVFSAPLTSRKGILVSLLGFFYGRKKSKQNLSEGSAREGTSLHGGNYSHISETRRELWDRANLEQEELRFWVRAFA
jgi:hypothetical protein